MSAHDGSQIHRAAPTLDHGGQAERGKNVQDLGHLDPARSVLQPVDEVAADMCVRRELRLRGLRVVVVQPVRRSQHGGIGIDDELHLGAGVGRVGPQQDGVAIRQAGQAALAASIARRVSAWLMAGTSPITSPVAGLRTAIVLPLSACTQAPAM